VIIGVALLLIILFWPSIIEGLDDAVSYILIPLDRLERILDRECILPFTVLGLCTGTCFGCYKNWRITTGVLIFFGVIFFYQILKVTLWRGYYRERADAPTELWNHAENMTSLISHLNVLEARVDMLLKAIQPHNNTTYLRG